MGETNKRLREAREAKFKETGDPRFESASAVAKAFNWLTEEGHVSTYLSHENEKSLSKVPEAKAKIYGPVLGVNPWWILCIPGAARHLDKETPRPTPDGEKIRLRDLEPDQAKTLEAAIGGRRAEVWRVTNGDVMAAAGYQVGDFLVVDLAARPKSQNFVLAEQQGIPIIRQYIGKYLYYLPLTGQPAPLIVDDVRIMLKGVIVSKLSI